MKTRLVVASLVLAGVVGTFYLGCGGRAITRTEGDAWLSRHDDRPAIDISGIWESEEWGRGTFAQEGAEVSGSLGGYPIFGRVSGKRVYLLIMSGSQVRYTAHLIATGSSLLSGEWGDGEFSDATSRPGQIELSGQMEEHHAAPASIDFVIHWNIESDPQGANVYWRVVSQTEEVMNMNKRYLGKTPYEESRPLNIEGLTKANATDVSIEVEVSKRGYEPQKKRFNCRSVIDQREISMMFEMVEKVD